MKCYSFSFIKSMPVALAVFCSLLMMVHHVLLGCLALGMAVFLWYFTKSAHNTFNQYISLLAGVTLFVLTLATTASPDQTKATSLKTNASLLSTQAQAQNLEIKTCPCAMFHGGEKASPASGINASPAEQKRSLSALKEKRTILNENTFNTSNFSAVSDPHNF